MATDWFCTSTGAGAHSGVDEANAFDLAEAISEINTPVEGWADGDTMNVKADATYTTAGIIISNSGAVGNCSKLRGYTDTIGDGGKTTIERSGGVAELIRISAQWFETESFILDGKSSGTYNLYPSSNSLVRFVESKNAGTNGFNYGTYFACYAHNNGGRGFSSTANQYYCVSVNNGIHGFESGRQYFCISKGNTGDNFYRTYGFIHSISDGGSGDGVEVLYFIYAINSVVINAPVGKEGMRFLYPSADQDVIKNIDFYGNDSDTNVAAFIADGKQTVDPQFNDTDNLDYTRTGTNLDDKGFSEVGMVSGVNYNIDIGIDQKAPAGAAPTFAGVVQLEAVGGGCLRATWAAGSGLTGYKIYVRKNSSDLFSNTYLKAEIPSTDTEFIFRVDESNNTFLTSTDVYYVGIRAVNTGTEDSNTETLSTTIAGGGETYLNMNDIIAINAG